VLTSRALDTDGLFAALKRYDAGRTKSITFYEGKLNQTPSGQCRTSFLLAIAPLMRDLTSGVRSLTPFLSRLNP